MTDKSHLKKILQRAKNDKVFFAKNFLRDPDNEPYELEPHQAAFLNDPHPFKILLCSRRSGKSLLFQMDILHKLFFLKNQNIGALFPTLAQAREFGKTFDDLVYRSPLISSSFAVDNKLDKMLINRNRFKIASAGTKSGQSEDSAQVGAGFSSLLLDETQSLDEESLSTIIPTILGQKSNTTTLMLAGTPRTKRDFFYKNIQNSFQITDTSKSPTPKPLKKDGIFSLHRFQVTEVDETGKILYTRSPKRLSIADLESVRSVIGTEKFRREFCLEFLDTTSLPFYDELVQAQGYLSKPDVFQSKQLCVGGIDFGKVRNNSVLCIAEFNPKIHKWEAKYFKSWNLGTKYQDIIHYINNILPIRFPKLLMLGVDATGVGKSITEGLNYHNRFEIKDILFSQPMKVSLVENSVMNLETDYVRFYKHPTLDKEMASYTRLINDNGRVLFEKGESDDFVDAFNMCNNVITDVTNKGLLYKTNIAVTGLGGSIVDMNKNFRGSNPTYNTYNLRQARENKQGISSLRR